MITVAEEIRRIVMTSPFLEEGLSRGIVNYSALARQLQPEIQTTLLKPVSESAILMALKRLSGELENRSRPGEQQLRNTGDLTVRSNLSEFTYHKSMSMMEKQKLLLDELGPSSEQFVTFTQGVFEMTVIVSSGLKEKVARIFASEGIVHQADDLSALIVKFPSGAADIPGIHYPILRQLAWKNVSILEIISTYTELTIVLQRQQVELAFGALHEYFTR